MAGVLVFRNSRVPLPASPIPPTCPIPLALRPRRKTPDESMLQPGANIPAGATQASGSNSGGSNGGGTDAGQRVRPSDASRSRSPATDGRDSRGTRRVSSPDTRVTQEKGPEAGAGRAHSKETLLQDVCQRWCTRWWHGLFLKVIILTLFL